MIKKLTYIGRDDWSRPLYQDETTRIWVDTDPRSNHAPRPLADYRRGGALRPHESRY